MLLRFGVANHRSIRAYQELYLSASRRIKRKGLAIPVPTLKEDAVPIVALYGGNAAGKSNLIDAMGVMQQVIVRSHKLIGATDRIPREPFRLDDTGSAKSTRFDCTFTLGGRATPGQDPQETESVTESATESATESVTECVYEYGFEYVDTEFRREWLYRMTRKERQSTRILFERKTEEGKVCVRFGSSLRGENRAIANMTRPNSLFLSAGAQNNHSLLTDLYRYFAERWTVILSSEVMEELDIAERLSNYEHTERLLSLVRQADLGIVDIGVDTSVENQEFKEERANLARDIAGVYLKHSSQSQGRHPINQSALVDSMLDRKRLRFMHSAAGDRSAAFEYGTESKGTRTLISLLVPALEALSCGSLLVIDELDTSLHASLARAFVSIFAKADSNPHGAQLIFSTHDVSQLGSGLINQDEIWMTDKSHEGETTFTPLTDFKLRSRDDIEKAYRLGRLGGNPVGDDFFVSFRDNRSSAEP